MNKRWHGPTDPVIQKAQDEYVISCRSYFRQYQRDLEHHLHSDEAYRIFMKLTMAVREKLYAVVKERGC